MGRKPSQIDPEACEHLVERLRHGRRRFHSDHVPTIMAWLYMLWAEFDQSINDVDERNPVNKLPHAEAYQRWLVSMRDALAHAMRRVGESWGAADWDAAVRHLWAGETPHPEVPPVELQVFKDDGNPHGD